MKTKFGLSEPPPVSVTNNGIIGSLWAAVQLERGHIFSLFSGPGLGGGFLDGHGQFASGLYELGYLTVLLKDTDPERKHKPYDIYGAAQSQLSQAAVVRLAHLHKVTV